MKGIIYSLVGLHRFCSHWTQDIFCVHLEIDECWVFFQRSDTALTWPVLITAPCIQFECQNFSHGELWKQLQWFASINNMLLRNYSIRPVAMTRYVQLHHISKVLGKKKKSWVKYKKILSKTIHINMLLQFLASEFLVILGWYESHHPLSSNSSNSDFGYPTPATTDSGSPETEAPQPGLQVAHRSMDFFSNMAMFVCEKRIAILGKKNKIRRS